MRTFVYLSFCLAVVCGQSMNFLAIGDWGGQSSSPYTTPPQVACASAMGRTGSAIDSQFTLALGDNFYDDGIRGDMNDPRFEETYANVFTADSLASKPWYAIAGNHDHLGNVSAEIAYTKLSKNWNYPDWYYSINKQFGDTTLQIMMIDTCILAGDSYHDEANDIFVEPRGPPSVSSAEEQWNWIEDELAASTADYLFVAGHYPVWSICSHGPTSVLVDRLKPLLIKYNATGYLSGHDHCQEYLVDENIHYILTGAGHMCCYSPDNMDKVPAGSLKFHIDGDNHGNSIGGYASLSVTSTGLTASYHDATSGNVQYTTPSIPPRPKASLQKH